MLVKELHSFYAEEAGEGLNMKTILAVSRFLALNKIIQVN